MSKTKRKRLGCMASPSGRHGRDAKSGGWWCVWCSDELGPPKAYRLAHAMPPRPTKSDAA